MKREASRPWSKSHQGAVPGSKLMGLTAGAPHPHLPQDPLVAHFTDRVTARAEPSVASMSQGKSLPWLGLSPLISHSTQPFLLSFAPTWEPSAHTAPSASFMPLLT